jgi:hypothetical protein
MILNGFRVSQTVTVPVLLTVTVPVLLSFRVFALEIFALYSSIDFLEPNVSRNRVHKDAERSGAALCDPSLRAC